jgi:hypothetical protein
MGFPYVLADRWWGSPGMFNFGCRYFYEHDYTHVFLHHMDSILCGPVLDNLMDAWNAWRRRGIICGAIQPCLTNCHDAGITEAQWWTMPFTSRSIRAYEVDDRPLEQPHCQFLIHLPSWKAVGEVNDLLYHYDEALGMAFWAQDIPIMYTHTRGEVLHLGGRTFPGSIYVDLRDKFHNRLAYQEAIYGKSGWRDKAKAFGQLYESRYRNNSIP